MRAVRVLPLVLAILIPLAGRSQDSPRKVDPKAYLSQLSRLGARKAFLTDSPDVYLEPAGLNQFFTTEIYRRLEGNVYFGYRFDEGFGFEGTDVQIEMIRDLTSEVRCTVAYRLALEKALSAAGIEIKPAAPYQIGICIVGIEDRETDKTLPGVMVEAYLRNAQAKKSFFIRYGAGSLRSLAAATRLSAEMLVAELDSRRMAKIRKQIDGGSWLFEL
jgi:hypothetical protein